MSSFAEAAKTTVLASVSSRGASLLFFSLCVLVKIHRLQYTKTNTRAWTGGSGFFGEWEDVVRRALHLVVEVSLDDRGDVVVRRRRPEPERVRLRVDGDEGVGVAIDGTPAFCVENNETTYLAEDRTYVFTKDAKIVAAKVVAI